MFRLILLTAREVVRTGDWQLPASYFAFWTVRLGGWLPQFGRCAECGAAFGTEQAFHASWTPGLLCQNCKRPGMRPLSADGRRAGERFAREKLDGIADVPAVTAVAELREAALSWIEHHTERKLKTRELLETS
jgi:recombinational DNA repair protein (RecF pathway)